LFPDLLTQAEALFNNREPSIHAFIPDEKRFSRLQVDAENLLRAYPDQIHRPVLFGGLAGVKDIFHVDGFITQAGSRLPAEALQGMEAECVRRLKSVGALILGKTVTTEFAYFTPGPTRNPHNPEHTPGGSSSGSAAAVAAGLCHFALGTQTIGSVVRPASFCGVVGVKPTYDRISRQGVIPLSPSLDHVGFFAPDMAGALKVASVLYSDWSEPTRPLREPQFGIPEGSFLKFVSEEARVHFEKICDILTTSYKLQRIPMMTDFQSIRDRHDVILSAEAALVHSEWFQQYEELYSSKFKELIQCGRTVTSSQLSNALSERDDFRAELRRSFLDHNIDLWICPSTIGAAPKGIESTGDPIMNLPWTQAGLPTINLPAGKNQEGLPLGLQLVGNWYKDESLLYWAKDLEKAVSNL
jgi:Asp-tRNA(Asn)/Glu-tRNA(Gln) amidotransferase A subunit family amidase